MSKPVAIDDRDDVRLDDHGNYCIVHNAALPPATISGNFYKLGHFVKNWKYRYVVVTNGCLSYYRTNSYSEMMLKGSITLQGYSVRKAKKRQIYLWCTEIGRKGKDLLLELPKVQEDNKYSLQVWMSALRAHIRFTNGTYVPQFNWTKVSKLTMSPGSPPGEIMTKTFQVVKRDGVTIQSDFEENSMFVGILKYHEIVEIMEMVLNMDNSFRGRLASGEGWVTLSSYDGVIGLLEIRSNLDSDNETDPTSQHFSSLISPDAMSPQAKT